jgi:uncharacterized membrane protein (UPF0127 family)
MGWLLRNGEVLASLEVADTRSARRRGLLGRDGIEGVLLLVPARSVHTLGMRFAIDVAFCDKDMVVLKTTTMQRHRMGMPVARSHAVIEAEAGAFGHWNLKAGDKLDIKE